MLEMRPKVLAHCRLRARRLKKYAPKRMAESALGVVTVEYANRECDVYFDSRLWRFANPSLWEDSSHSPSQWLVKADLKIMEGEGFIPPARTIPEMFASCRDQLSPFADIDFHRRPKYFKF